MTVNESDVVLLLIGLIVLSILFVFVIMVSFISHKNSLDTIFKLEQKLTDRGSTKWYGRYCEEVARSNRFQEQNKALMKTNGQVFEAYYHMKELKEKAEESLKIEQKRSDIICRANGQDVGPTINQIRHELGLPKLGDAKQ